MLNMQFLDHNEKHYKLVMRYACKRKFNDLSNPCLQIVEENNYQQDMCHSRLGWALCLTLT